MAPFLEALKLWNNRRKRNKDILSKDAPSVPARDTGDIACDIHLERFQDTTIVSRHIAWLVRHHLGDALKSRVYKLSEELLKQTTVAGVRIATLKAICVLTTEDPLLRDAMKNLESSHKHIHALMTDRSGSEVRAWAASALLAIDDEEFYEVWSDVVTDPAQIDVRKRISRFAAAEITDGNNPGLHTKSPRSGESLMVDHCLDIASKLKRDGPSKHDVQVIIRLIQEVRKHKAPPQEILFKLLLKYVRNPSTAITAMEEIQIIAEDPSARKILQKCEKQVSAISENLKSDIKKVQACAANTLSAVTDDTLHEKWSETKIGGWNWSQIQDLLDKLYGPQGRASSPPYDKGALKNDWDAVRDATIAEHYFHRAAKTSINDAVCQIRRILKHDAPSQTIEARHKRARNWTCKDEGLVGESCIELLNWASRSPPNMAIVALNHIIALSIEDPFVRELLGRNNDQVALLENRTQPEIHKWSSRAFQAITNSNVHEIWSKVFINHLNMHEMEHLLDRSIYSDTGDLAELAKSLSPDNLDSSYIAYQYLELAANIHNSRVKFSSNTDTSKCEECKRKAKTKGVSNYKWKSSRELLKYVLESAPEGSLNDLSGITFAECEESEIGKGGFAKVYKIRIQDKDIAVKKLVLDADKTELVIRNFARELRVCARVRHPNVLTLLGYVLEDKEDGLKLCLVSEFMGKGSLQQYLAKKKSDKQELTDSKLSAMCLDVANAVCYLHSKNIVHADIKSANVLISRFGHYVLADYGLARMSQSLWSKGYYSTEVSRASGRWVAREFFHIANSEMFRPSLKTDVWAFGMILLEILTQDVPYAHIRSDGAVSRAIMEGDSPVSDQMLEIFESLGASLEKGLWSLCRKCWEKNPDIRPTMKDNLHELIRLGYRFGVRPACTTSKG